MKLTLTFVFLVIVFVVFSCGDKSGKGNGSGVDKLNSVVPPSVEGRVLGCYLDRDTVVKPGVLGRLISDKIVYDSVSKTKIVVTDSSYFVEREMTELDSATGKPKKIWVIITKDSIDTKIQDLPLDSIYRRFKTKFPKAK